MLAQPQQDLPAQELIDDSPPAQRNALPLLAGIEQEDIAVEPRRTDPPSQVDAGGAQPAAPADDVLPKAAGKLQQRQLGEGGGAHAAAGKTELADEGGRGHGKDLLRQQPERL